LTDYKHQWNLEQVAQYEEGKVQCVVCGSWYHVLGGHVYRTHGVTIREYKRMLGIRIKTKLTSPQIRNSFLRPDSLSCLRKGNKNIT
jgi:hypothetical protein